MHAHFTDIGYMVSKLHKKMHIPLVMTEHYSGIMKHEIDKRLYYTANEAYKNADVLITVSPALRNVIKEKFDKEAIYIPNIVDIKLFNYTPKKIQDGIFRFVSVGALKLEKRIDLTIEAFAHAFSDNEKVTLTIYGKGPEKSKLEKLIQSYHIDDRVKLMGLQSRKDIAAFLKKSDCFVLASQAETFGVVYIEALASGLPVIATKCGGPECIVNDKNGLLIPVNDSNALAEAMKNIYHNISKYDRESIAKEAGDLYSPCAIANRLDEVYEEVIAEAPKFKPILDNAK